MDIAGFAIHLMELLGGPGIALVIAAEALFPPVPGEVLLPFAGVSAAADGQHVLVPIAWTTAGSVLGGLGVYAVGRTLGLERTRRLVRRLPLLEDKDVDMAVRFFDRHGFPAVALARFVPMVRTFISLPAGVARMPFGRYLVASVIGGLLWADGIFLLGYWLGHIDFVRRNKGYIDYAVIAVIIIVLLPTLLQLVRSRRRPTPSS